MRRPLTFLIGFLGLIMVPLTLAKDYPKALVIGQGEPFRDPDGGPSHASLAKRNFLRLVDNPDNDPKKGWTCDLSWDLAKDLGLDPEKISVEDLFKFIREWKLNYKLVINNEPIGQLKPYWEAAIESGMMPVAAHYNNTGGLYIADEIGLRTCIGVAGGMKENVNTYGPALEFFDALPGRFAYSGFEDPAQSWASQVVAAKFARIMNEHPEYNIWDTRQHLRQAADRWETGWEDYNGFGRINPDKEISELMPAPPVNFYGTVIENGNQVVFKWRNFEMSDFANTVIGLKGGGILYRGKDTQFTWDSTVSGTAQFLYWSENTKGEKSRMESFQTRTLHGLKRFSNRSCMIVGAGPRNDRINEVLRRQFLRIADNWLCDVAYIRGNPIRDKTDANKVGSNLGVFDSYEAMVDYAIKKGYSMLVVATDFFRAREIYQQDALWEKALEADMAVILPHGFTLSPTMLSVSQQYVPDRLMACMTVGRGTGSNDLSHGPGLEFIDDAPPFEMMVDDTSENTAAAVVGGKLARILDLHPDYNYWDARQHLRQLSGREWNPERGFGRIDLGDLKLDKLDLAPPVGIRFKTLNDGRRIRFEWTPFKQSQFAGTVIRRDGEFEVYRGQDEVFEWESDREGEADFYFHTLGKDGSLSKTQPFSIVHVTGLTVK